MNKKYKIIITLCIIVILFSTLSIIYIINNDIKYDINKPIKDYKFTTKEETYDYYKFLVSKIEPKELQKYDDELWFSASDYTIKNNLLENCNGNDQIHYIKRDFWIQYINYHMFYDSISSDMPLSKKFLKKFKNGILEYFNVENKEYVEVKKLDQDEQIIILYEQGIDEVKEDGDILFYTIKEYELHYTLDKKGYIDDLELISER